MKPALKITTIVIAVLLFIVTVAAPTITFAQTDGESVAEKNARELQDLLKLVLPEQTDNPSYIIKFEDPSPEDDAGVSLQIDGGKEEEITSPHTLPQLVVGSHTLIFKFKDADETSKELEKKIVILPRMPEISANKEITEDGKLKVNGEAAGQADVLLILTTPSELLFGQAQSDIKGVWTYEFEGDFSPGRYALIAQTQKKGYKSDFSTPLNFEIAQQGETGPSDISEEEIIQTDFVLKEFNDISNVKKIFQNNPDLTLYSGVLILAGIVLSTLLNGFWHSFRENRKAKKFSQVFNSDRKPKIEKNSDEAQEKLISNKTSLREKFEQAGLKKGALAAKSSDVEPDNKKDKKEKLVNKQINELNNDLLGEQSNRQIETQSQEIQFESHSNSSATETNSKTDKKIKPVKSKRQKASAPKGKTMSKEEFLKEFKNFAPKEVEENNEDGRNIKISINSKQVKK